MAKAKNESTAINDLINLVNTATPLPPDPDEDLMFADPRRRAPGKSQAVSIPRMSQTVPTLKAGADVEPLPRHRGAQGTGENLVTPPQVRVSTAPPSRQTTIPPLADPASGSAPFPSPAPPPPPRAGLNNRFDLSAASSVGHNIPASSIGITVPAAPLARPSAPTSDLDEPTFDFDEAPASRHEQTWVGTVQTPKSMSTAQWIGRLAPIAGAMIVIGIFVGGYVAFDGEGGHKRSSAGATASVEMPKPAAALAPAAEPAKADVPAVAAEPTKADEPVAAKAEEPVAAKADEPAAATTEAPVAATTEAPVAVKADEPVAAVAAPIGAKVNARPVFTDIRIDSNPMGATVTLIDRGKRMFLGTTPISTSVDISRQYDVELVYNNRPTVVEHLDPTSTKKLSVEIHRAKSATSTEVAKVASPAPKKAAAVSFADVTEKPAKKAEPATEAPAVKTEAPKAEPAPKAEAAAAAPASGGTGILMISSKPPCEILIDGRPTGLTTPQRSLPVSAGTHKITLVNATEKIKKTLTVQITADQPTKVIQDLMDK